MISQAPFSNKNKTSSLNMYELSYIVKSASKVSEYSKILVNFR